MRNIVTFFAAIFLMVGLSGCYTQKKAGNQMVKAHVEYPALSSFYCGQWYPIRWYDSTVIKYIQGNTEYLYDTVTVDCDSVVKLPNGDKSNIVRIPCPPCPVRVDTFIKDSNKQGESTAALYAERAKTQECLDQLNESNVSHAKEVAKLRVYLLIAGVLALYTVVRWVVRFWGVKLP